MFEGDSADTCTRKFPLMLMGRRANGPACADEKMKTILTLVFLVSTWWMGTIDCVMHHVSWRNGKMYIGNQQFFMGHSAGDSSLQVITVDNGIVNITEVLETLTVGDRDRDIRIRSYHMSCHSDTFDGSSNYIGIVLYQKDGSNSFSIHGRNIRPGYIYFVKTSKLSIRYGETRHAAAYRRLFGVDPPSTGLVSSGFSHYQGAFRKNSATFNLIQTAYTDVFNNQMAVEEFEMVKNAIISWSCNGQQNLVPKLKCRITRRSSNACPIHENSDC